MPDTLDVALLTLGDPDRLTGGYLFHRRMAERAASHAARLHFVSVPDRPFPLAMLDARLALRAAVNADALVLDSLVAAFVAPWLALGRPHIPTVAMLHQTPGGMESDGARRVMQAQLDWLAYRSAARLMVASEALGDEMVAAGVSRARVRMVLPGRDGPGRSGAVPLGDLCQGRSVAFLCVANWLARKGIHDLLEAFALLPERAATLHLVGDTESDPRYAARIRARLAQPDLARRVVVHGRVAPELVPSLYAAAAVFVLPSLKETYGTVYTEAMAAGLPVVGYRAGNLPHLADDGREGLLVAPGDIAGLSHALRRLADDAELRRRLGSAARVRAECFPTWDESASVFFGEIREVVEAAKRAASEVWLATERRPDAPTHRKV